MILCVVEFYTWTRYIAHLCTLHIYFESVGFHIDKYNDINIFKLMSKIRNLFCRAAKCFEHLALWQGQEEWSVPRCFWFLQNECLVLYFWRSDSLLAGICMCPWVAQLSVLDHGCPTRECYDTTGLGTSAIRSLSPNKILRFEAPLHTTFEHQLDQKRMLLRPASFFYKSFAL